VPEEHVEGPMQAGYDRRALVKKLAVGAFSAPVIASFSLDSIARAGTSKGKKHDHHGKQAHPNQTCGNQTDGNQTWGNQTIPNQTCDPKHKKHKKHEDKHPKHKKKKHHDKPSRKRRPS
jgi:hypothetical protein